MSFSFKTEKIEKGTCIILHGYGANAQDLEFLGQEWHKLLPNWNFLGFNGIKELEENSYAWFDLNNNNWDEGLNDCAKYLEDLFHEYSRPLIIIGFSQGGFLAAHMALYSKLNIKCAIAFCAGIIPFQTQTKETQLYLINNKNDPIISQNWFKQSIQFAKEHDITCNGFEINSNEHTITQEAFEIATEIIINQTSNFIIEE